MIIRLTFADNDFTHYLEQFCEGLRDKMFLPTEELPEENHFLSFEEYCKAAFDFFK